MLTQYGVPVTMSAGNGGLRLYFRECFCLQRGWVMESRWTDAELLGYLDEALVPERMTALELELRNSGELRSRAAALQRTRHQGAALSEIWQRARVSCPSRMQLAAYVAGTLPAEWMDYVAFHLRTAGCRYCQANVEDLQQREGNIAAQAVPRRKKIFQSSAGRLRTQPGEHPG